jgi:hypothetical protein
MKPQKRGRSLEEKLEREEYRKSLQREKESLRKKEEREREEKGGGRATPNLSTVLFHLKSAFHWTTKHV